MVTSISNLISYFSSCTPMRRIRRIPPGTGLMSSPPGHSYKGPPFPPNRQTTDITKSRPYNAFFSPPRRKGRSRPVRGKTYCSESTKIPGRLRFTSMAGTGITCFLRAHGLFGTSYLSRASHIVNADNLSGLRQIYSFGNTPQHAFEVVITSRRSGLSSANLALTSAA